MTPPGAKTSHFNGDSQVFATQEVDQIKEVVSSKVEEANNMIKGLAIEEEVPQDEAEGMTMVITAMARAILTSPEEEVDPFKDGHGGRVVSNQEEGATHCKREQETRSTGVYHSISIYAVYVETKVIMTINAIPYNTWPMQYKPIKHRATTL